MFDMDCAYIDIVYVKNILTATNVQYVNFLGAVILHPEGRQFDSRFILTWNDGPLTCDVHCIEI